MTVDQDLMTPDLSGVSTRDLLTEHRNLFNPGFDDDLRVNAIHKELHVRDQTADELNPLCLSRLMGVGNALFDEAWDQVCDMGGMGDRDVFEAVIFAIDMARGEALRRLAAL